MIQINLNPFMEIETERRLEEIRKVAAQNRIAYAKENDTAEQEGKPAHILARIGKGMSAIGSSLEARYGKQPVDHRPNRNIEYR